MARWHGVGLRGGLDAVRIGEAVRLERRESGLHFPSRDLLQKTLLLLLAPRLGERDACEHDGREERTGHRDTPHLLEDDDEVDHVEAGAARGLGEDEAHPSEVGHLPPHLPGVPDVVVHHAPDVRHRTFLGEEVPRRLAQHLLLFAEAEIHPVPPIRAAANPG